MLETYLSWKGLNVSSKVRVAQSVAHHSWYQPVRMMRHQHLHMPIGTDIKIREGEWCATHRQLWSVFLQSTNRSTAGGAKKDSHIISAEQDRRVRAAYDGIVIVFEIRNSPPSRATLQPPASLAPTGNIPGMASDRLTQASTQACTAAVESTLPV